MNQRTKILISILIGIVAAYLSTVLPKTVVYGNVQLGDICVPLFQFKNFVLTHSAYPKFFYNGNIPAVVYPFTTVLFLSPLLVFPLNWIGPIFCGLTSSVFAYALLYDGKPWRLLVLTSVPYLASLQSIQFAPLLASAIYLPFLLPVAVLKPQLGIPLLTVGKWSKTTVLAALSIVLISLIIYPTWPFDWLTYGNLSFYAGKIPVTQGFGFLLLLSCLKWRDERARLLLTMALIPQRIWYDQLALFLIPRTRVQLYILLVCSWLSPFVGSGGVIDSSRQDPKAWAAVVSFVYFPLLLMVFQEEIIKFTKRVKKIIIPE